MVSRNIDLKAFKLKAGRNKKAYMTFLKGIHKRNGGEQINKWARTLDKDAFAKIDCLSCGNCCKTMTPTFLPADVKRIARYQKISTKEFHDRYLITDDKEYVNKNVPCQFLNADNKCSIYAIRPVDCRGFPHTHKANPGFVGASSVNQMFFFRCPIVYHVVENIFKRVVNKTPVTEISNPVTIEKSKSITAKV